MTRRLFWEPGVAIPTPQVYRIGGSAYRVHASGLVEYQPAKGQRFHRYAEGDPAEILRQVTAWVMAEAERLQNSARVAREEAAQAVAAVMALEAAAMPCPTCNGMGSDDGSTSGDVAICPDCDGTGWRAPCADPGVRRNVGTRPTREVAR